MKWAFRVSFLAVVFWKNKTWHFNAGPLVCIKGSFKKHRDLQSHTQKEGGKIRWRKHLLKFSCYFRNVCITRAFPNSFRIADNIYTKKTVSCPTPHYIASLPACVCLHRKAVSGMYLMHLSFVLMGLSSWRWEGHCSSLIFSKLLAAALPAATTDPLNLFIFSRDC